MPDSHTRGGGAGPESGAVVSSASRVAEGGGVDLVSGGGGLLLELGKGLQQQKCSQDATVKRIQGSEAGGMLDTYDPNILGGGAEG